VLAPRDRPALRRDRTAHRAGHLQLRCRTRFGEVAVNETRNALRYAALGGRAAAALAAY